MNAISISTRRNWFSTPFQSGDYGVDDNKSGVTWAASPDVRATIDADDGVLLDIRKGALLQRQSSCCTSP